LGRGECLLAQKKREGKGPILGGRKGELLKLAQIFGRKVGEKGREGCIDVYLLMVEDFHHHREGRPPPYPQNQRRKERKKGMRIIEKVL